VTNWQAKDPILVFWLPAINPYWAKRFTQLALSGNVTFECWFNAERGKGREWVVPASDMEFPHRFLPRGLLTRNLAVIRRWRQVKPDRIFTFHFDPSLWPSMLMTIGSGRTLAFYIEKTWDSWISRRWVKERLKRCLFSHADIVFCPGDDAARYVRKYRLLGPLQRLPHVVDVDLLSTAIDRRASVKDLRLLYLGRFVREKGLEDLMAAVSLLPVDCRVSLHLVGAGPMLDTLKEWASKSSISVTLQGFVQHAEIVPVLAGADVLVFPTHGDPYGLVVDEALASGMTVISSSAAGEILSRLVDGPERPRGLVIPPYDPAALAAAIERLACDRETVKKMMVAARSYTKSHSMIEDWVHSIEEWCERSHELET
jgi:glycosyltransferase involved in cell wall biosynthesis